MLSIDLTGRRALVAGIGNDKGYGWAIAKALARAGAQVAAAAWPPDYWHLLRNLARGRLDTSLDGEASPTAQLAFEKVYPLDVLYDTGEDVPEDVRSSPRYREVGDCSIEGLARSVERDFGKGALHIVVHAIANGPEARRPLIETSRAGYLAAMSASAYSFVALVRALSPLMPEGGTFLTLTYHGAQKVIPGYGGGMAAAKAALECDTRVLAFEAGRAYGHRVNAISAGPLLSRAGRALGGLVERVAAYSEDNAPLSRKLCASDVAFVATFLCSDLARAVTGEVVYVDNGANIVGVPSPRGAPDTSDAVSCSPASDLR